MRLDKELDKIKNERKEEKRLKKLREICIDVETLNTAIEIAKYESTLHAPLLAFGLASFVFTLTLLTSELLRKLTIWALFLGLFYITISAMLWTNVYYDLLEIRRNIQKEKNKDISTISQTDKEYDRELQVG